MANKSLVVARNDEFIQDYYLYNYNTVDIDEGFRYTTFDYDFVAPFTITVGENTGLIYILAYENQSSDNLVLLVFRSGVSSFRTFYKELKVEDNVRNKI